MMTKQKLVIYSASIILMFISSLYINAAKSIKYFVLAPPEQMLEDVKKIAVLDFSSIGSYRRDDGRKASDYMVASLLKKDRGIHAVEKGISRFLKKEILVSKKSIFNKILGKGSEGKTFQQGINTDFYDISERSRIKKVIEEQNFSNSGMVDQNQAAELGKVLGVDAVISGNVKVNTEKKRYYNKISKEYFYINEAAATLSMRIVGVSSGKILGQKVTVKTVAELADEFPMDIVKDEAIKAAANDLVFYFAPSFRLEKIKFQVLKSKQHKKASKKAIHLLEKGEFGRSLAIYSSIVNKDTYNHKAIYMQGLLYELACNYDKALERYNMAYRIFDESDLYYKSIERVEEQKSMWKVLNKHDIFLTVMDLELSEKQLASANRPKVKLKGDCKIRIPVFMSPENSNVLMKIPGGISLDLINRESDFYKVKLVTGQEGYIHIKDVK